MLLIVVIFSWLSVNLFVIAKNTTLLCCRYFSLQATCPLGFGDKIRFYVEHSICREEGPQPDCFRKPADIVFYVLEKVTVLAWASLVSFWYLPWLVLHGAYRSWHEYYVNFWPIASVLYFQHSKYHVFQVKDPY